MFVGEISQYVKKKKKLRDKALHFHYMPVDEAKLMEKLHAHFDFPKITRKLRARAFLGLVIIGVRNSQFGHFTSFSAQEGWYAGRGEHYGGPHFTYSHINESFKTVRDSGIFIEIRKPPGTNNDGQSVFMATPELIELVRDVPIIETPREILQVRNNEKKSVIITDTEFSVQRRREIIALNDWYRSDVQVSFDQKYHQFGDWYWIEGQWKQVRPIHTYCIFNRKSWDCGGRLYSWTTNLNKKARKQIKLNGEKTVELDYKTLHPTMLFAMAGKQLERDVYSHNDVDRESYKVGFLAVMNGKARNKAAYSMRDKNEELGLSLSDANRLIENIELSVPELQEYFYSDIGVKLQRKDSDIIMSCLNKLRTCNIPALSIHDSLVVPTWAKSKTEAIMLDSFSEFFPNTNIKVEVK